MSSLVEQIASMDNLMLAWRKIENLFIPGDIWFDPLRLASFKYRLKDNLESVRDDLLNGTYTLHKIKPVPFPKKKKGDEYAIRQSFIVDISDQLVWVAVCNIIGVYLDSKMPAWSYGNRLYMYWWKDKADRWQIGNYRNSTPLLYRNWNQSWPQMKTRITASLKRMAFANDAELDENEEVAIEQEKQMGLSYAKLKYLNDNYFTVRKGEETEALFWIGLDLTKFYTRVKIGKVVDIILRELGQRIDARFVALLKHLIAFEIDNKDYENDESGLNLMDLSLDEVSYDGLPTGLLVAGFLANVFMLDIDRKADKYLDKHHDVIHFRYVDDHVIIGRTSDALKCWVDIYLKLLKDAGLEINGDKAEPQGVLKNKEGNISFDMEVLRQRGNIDARYPSPLMTQTLQKVSMLSKEKLPLLTPAEFNLVFKDLQAMLVTDIPETEIKKATRISFACTMLSRMMRNGNIDYHEVYRTRRELYDTINKNPRIDELMPLLNRGDLGLAKCKEEKFEANELNSFRHLEEMIKEGNKKGEILSKTIFNLLMRSLNEVPDKVKIWVRAFLFAVNHYPKGIILLCKQLEHVQKESLHPLSVLYLKSVIEFLSADSILEIVKYLYTDDYTTGQDRNRDIEALNYLLEISFEDEGFGFKQISSLALRHSRSVYEAHCGELGLPQHICERPFDDVFEYEDGVLLDSTFWALWKLENLDERKETAALITNRMLKNVKIQTDSPYFEAFVFQMLSAADIYDREYLNNFPEIAMLDPLSKELKYALRMSGIDYGAYVSESPVRNSTNNDEVNLFEWISSKNGDLRIVVMR